MAYLDTGWVLSLEPDGAGLRITVTATHETADIELLADALEEAAGASQVSAAGDRLRDAVRAAEPVSQHMSAS